MYQYVYEIWRIYSVTKTIFKSSNDNINLGLVITYIICLLMFDNNLEFVVLENMCNANILYLYPNNVKNKQEQMIRLNTSTYKICAIK